MVSGLPTGKTEVTLWLSTVEDGRRDDELWLFCDVALAELGEAKMAMAHQLMRQTTTDTANAEGPTSVLKSRAVPTAKDVFHIRRTGSSFPVAPIAGAASSFC
jgi:hypothetical protein